MSYRNTERYERWNKVSRVASGIILAVAICFAGAGFSKGLHAPPPKLLTSEEYMQRVTSAVEQAGTPYMREYAYWTATCSVTDELNRIIDSRRSDVYAEFESQATLYFLDMLREGQLPYRDLLDWAERGTAKRDCSSLVR